jgi:hypothetical protein
MEVDHEHAHSGAKLVLNAISLTNCGNCTGGNYAQNWINNVVQPSLSHDKIQSFEEK